MCNNKATDLQQAVLTFISLYSFLHGWVSKFEAYIPIEFHAEAAR